MGSILQYTRGVKHKIKKFKEKILIKGFGMGTIKKSKNYFAILMFAWKYFQAREKKRNIKLIL